MTCDRAGPGQLGFHDTLVRVVPADAPSAALGAGLPWVFPRECDLQRLRTPSLFCMSAQLRLSARIEEGSRPCARMEGETRPDVLSWPGEASQRSYARWRGQGCSGAAAVEQQALWALSGSHVPT